jgi:hypothetical protein
MEAEVFEAVHFSALWHENSALLWQWQAYEYPLRQQVMSGRQNQGKYTTIARRSMARRIERAAYSGEHVRRAAVLP